MSTSFANYSLTEKLNLLSVVGGIMTMFCGAVYAWYRHGFTDGLLEFIVLFLIFMFVEHVKIVASLFVPRFFITLVAFLFWVLMFRIVFDAIDMQQHFLPF